MNKEEAKRIAKKFLDGSASAEEKAALDQWYTANLEDAEEVVFTAEPEDAGAVKERLYKNIRQKLNETPEVPAVRRIKLWPKIAAAAAIFLAVGTAVYFYSNYANFRTESRLADTKVILPGTNGAILTLANGKTINLSKAKTGIVITTSGLTYTDGDSLTAGRNDDLIDKRQMSISTPKGGQYQVLLPDGTKVWLNAASSLKVPAGFADPKSAGRRVELRGEAYFEVARVMRSAGQRGKHAEKLSFVVATDKQEVQVLGTHFNISSYADESSVKTTLFEGSVRVSVSGLVQGTVLLSPGQQAVLAGQDIKVSQADLEEALAWKNGFFKFNSEPVQSVMRKLSRWYNVDVIYEGEISKDRVNGTISRNKNINEVLEMLEGTKLVKFKVEGRKVIVR